MAEKVTEMLLKVHDLGCSKCYKKVKKILCKFPEIQDQVYDEKNNTVKIKVACCSPEKIRDKIRCKGRGIIMSIEIVPKPQPKPEPKPEPKPQPKPEPKLPEKPKTPCHCGRNCDGWCGRPVKCSCGCGGHRGNCGRPVCSCGCGGHGGNCVRLVYCSCGCGGHKGNCGRSVCSCGCGGHGGNCVRLVYCSCGCGGYRGNCGSRCHVYYCIEDNSQGCSIM